MLQRVIARSLLARRIPLLVATAAVLLAAALIASLGTLALGMKTQVSRELEAYGANMILLPETISLPAGAGGLAFGEVAANAYIAESRLGLIDTVDEVKKYAPYLYSIATYRGQKVVMAGTLFNRLRELAPYWQIEGQWVNDGSGGSDAMIGRKVAQRFDLHPGDRISLDLGRGPQEFQVAGIANVGGSENDQIFVALRTAQILSGREGQMDLVQIRAATEKRPLPEIATGLAQSLSVRARVVGQVAGAEASVLFKIELLMALITALTVLASGVTVFSTLTTSVLERIKEIGLMKALGARDSRIALIFLAEAWAIGLAGGLLGNIIGLGLAQAIARSVFDSYLSPQITVIPVTLASAFILVTVAALGPVRNALAVEPVVTLRGE